MSTQQQQKMVRIRRRRRRANAARRKGVLLLVVLSVLIVFLATAVAFVLVAKQASRAAKSSNRGSIRNVIEADQQLLLDEVVLQLVRDTHNAHSALRYHSLLRDMYGNDGFFAQAEDNDTIAKPEWLPKWARDLPFDDTGQAVAVTSCQIIEFALDMDAGIGDLSGNVFGPVAQVADWKNTPISKLDNAYNGQVLTFLTGAAKGQSTRIVGYLPPVVDSNPSDSTPPLLRIMNFKLANGGILNLTNDPTTNDLAGARFLVNGKPFNGTGVGFNRWDTSADARLNAGENIGGNSYPIALLPNPSMFEFDIDMTGKVDWRYFLTDHELDTNNLTTQQQQQLILARGLTGLGGSDESYDAADFQNMILAMMPANPSPFVANGSSSLGNMVLPSLHRPALLNYWRQYLLAQGLDPLEQNPNLLRKVLLRPNWLDHPKFTGSNWAYARNAPPRTSSTEDYAEDCAECLNRMIYGPWDVDNDNDGIQDSMWVDFGASIVTMPDGTRVKPLAAVLCLDMDGRLNANAHGTLDLAMRNQSNLSTMPRPRKLAGYAQDFDPGTDFPLPLPRGLGYGPGDISLAPLLGQLSFQQLLIGEDTDNDNVIDDDPGRYGFDPVTGGNAPVPGVIGLDLMAQIDRFGWPDRADGWSEFRNAYQLSCFGTPPDVHARYYVGLDSLGRSAYEATYVDPTDPTNSLTELNRYNLKQESPYEMDLSSSTGRGVQSNSPDTPFSLAELERVLRAYDVEAEALPDRLRNLGGFESDSDQINRKRNAITTESYDLPSPSVAMPKHLRSMVVDGEMPPRSMVEIVEARVRKSRGLAKFPTPLSDEDNNTVRWIVRRLVSPDLADNLRLNVNRPLGNGRDDNGNGVVDEPWELDTTEDPQVPGSVWKLETPASTPQTPMEQLALDARVQFDAPEFSPLALDVQDPVLDTAAHVIDHRQLLARHLYVTALTLAADDSFGDGTHANEDKELARRLAQWAVNVVDFRDADSIMTAFEYDVNPFNGWGVDGNLSSNSSDNGESFRGLVWGAERPELVMTETLAWHDRATEDHGNEDPLNDEDGNGRINSDDATTVGGQDGDDDFDQVRRPRGAFFLELYNPWPANPGASADTHAILQPNLGQPERYDMGVRLNAVAVGNNRTSPVWRVAIYRAEPLNPPQNPQPMKDPDDPDQSERPLQANVDRTVYFVDSDPGYSDDGIAFFHDSGGAAMPSVRPGRYLVIGSGDSVGGGKYDCPLGDIDPNSAVAAGANRRIVLNTGNVDHTVRMNDDQVDDTADDRDGIPLAAPSQVDAIILDGILERNPCDDPGNPYRCVANVAIIDQVMDEDDGYDDNDPSDAVNDLTVQQKRRRLTLSEPARGYPDRVKGSQWDEDKGMYIDPGTQQSKPIDIPLDGPMPVTPPPVIPGYLQDIEPALAQLDTSVNYRWIYLQRLANPLLPWNPEVGHSDHNPDMQVNPYLTVDTISANITVFNGRDDEDFISGITHRNSPAENRFTGVQRGYKNDATQNAENLWSVEPLVRDSAFFGGAGQDTTPAPSSHFFNGIPNCTLGYLNRHFRDATAMSNPPTPQEVRKKQLIPAQPFPWLTWNNRPFVSKHELMLVPHVRSSQLLKTFTMAEDGSTQNAWPYVLDSNQQNPRDGFAHLENFFYEKAAGQPSQDEVPSGLYRLLEYLGTPSLFAGTQTRLNPSTNATQFGGAISETTDPRLNRQPPYNTVSDHREPGRVNLNTLFSSYVWQGLFHGTPGPNVTGSVHPGPTWEDFIKSRRGFDLADIPPVYPLKFDANTPTFFAQPFRSPDAGDLVPLNDMVRHGVDCTLLRSKGGDENGPSDDPLFAAETNQQYNDAARNAHFADNPMIRLSNLTTTRSGVYAVWITVGFFEVEEFDESNAAHKQILKCYGTGAETLADAMTDPLFNRVYPNGVMFGREYGSDTGEMRRVRGFYMIDRTMPAAFEPGVDHNVDQVIRLKRRIK